LLAADRPAIAGVDDTLFYSGYSTGAGKYYGRSLRCLFPYEKGQGFALPFSVCPRPEAEWMIVSGWGERQNQLYCR
jgi:hypothetical protein